MRVAGVLPGPLDLIAAARCLCVVLALSALTACVAPPLSRDAGVPAVAVPSIVVPRSTATHGGQRAGGAARPTPLKGASGAASAQTPDPVAPSEGATPAASGSTEATPVSSGAATRVETPPQRRYREVLERRLEETSGGISVRVIDETGVPVAGARVRFVNLLWAWEGHDLLPFAPSDLGDATSDLDGAVRFEHVGTRAAFAYAVLGERVACAVQGSRGHYRRPDDFELRLGPGVRFAGRVLDPTGAPVAGASVELHVGFRERFLDISRADGRFGGVLIPAGLAVDGARLRVGADGYDLHERKLDASAFGNDADIDVTLLR